MSNCTGTAEDVRDSRVYNAKLLSPGNTKIGDILSFSIPPKMTCTGMTEFCYRYCYATRGRYLWPSTQESLERNLCSTHNAAFVDSVVSEIGGRKIVRLHVSGDFYSNVYIGMWAKIVSLAPGTVFYGYTRAWRDGSLRVNIEAFRRLPNVRLRASVDFTHTDRPSGWNLFSIVDGEGVHCPHDLGKVDNCLECGLCWIPSVKSVFTGLRHCRMGDNLSPALI